MNSTTRRPIQMHQKQLQLTNNHNHEHQKSTPTIQNNKTNNNNNYNNSNGNLIAGYRRTSAEIVSEAKTLLAGGGARLVSTRRPITPREPRRQLYGKLAPPGRPPSAFSLQYLQFESRALPSLEPLHQQQQQQLDEIPFVPRSGSIGTLLDYADSTKPNHNQINNNHVRHQGKLPALLSPPKITASLDNLSEEIPPHPDLTQQIDTKNNNTDNNIDKNNDINKTLENIKDKNLLGNDSSSGNIIIKEHPLKSRQTKSFELPTTEKSDGILLKGLKKDKISIPNQIDSIETIKNQNVITKLDSGNIFMSKKRLTRNNDLLAQSTTETLLDLLKAHSGIKECTDETVQHINAILVELYTRVKGAKGNWRSAILGGLYGLVECSSPKILLAVARVVLALCVTGSNLTGACKLVFKVARNETNDHLFIDSDVPELLIDGLGRASPLDEPEACIYGYGAVRFLASSGQTGINIINNVKLTNSQILNKQKTIAQRLARHGAVQLMVLHLQILNEAGAIQKISGPPLHALYQLSAALRALAGISQIGINGTTTTATTTTITTSSLKSSIITDTKQTKNEEFPIIIKETKEIQEINLELACPHLVKAAEVSIGEAEIQSNIVRTLSVLSEHESCCESLSEFSARIGMLLGPCNEVTNGVPEKPLTLLSRLGYILGNIMARFDSARIQFYHNDVAMEYLLQALELYSNQKFSIHNQMGDTVVDVLIKLVRVIANMSVNPDVGFGLGSKSPLGHILLHLLITTNNTKTSNMSGEMEELLQATLGALHNLCFYQDNIEEQSIKTEQIGSMCERLPKLSIALCDTLNSGPESVRAEAARVLGNMTRNQIARESFCSTGGLKVIVNCLSSNDYELVETSSGVLVNLLGDWERRAPFRELKGPLVLYEILEKSGKQEDWLLAGIVCQALWNFLIDSGNVIRTLGEKEADTIAGNLAEYLDEERIFNGQEPNDIWEQFATVATDLLERIQSSMSRPNSPCNSSDDENDIIHSGLISNKNVEQKWGENFQKWLND